MAAPRYLDDLAAAKCQARERARQIRKCCDPSLGKMLIEHVIGGWFMPSGSVVAGFWPLQDEIDVRPVLIALHALGHPIVLPVTPARGLSLTFRRWRPGDTLVAGRYGTLASMSGVEMTPDILLVPMLAFDRMGRRLGYGGGYYDRTLAKLPEAEAIGCAFAAQELDEVPAGDYDARLHAVVTEAGLIVCKGR